MRTPTAMQSRTSRPLLPYTRTDLRANAAPSVGRSLNSRGFLNPRILACKASQSERLTRMTFRQKPHTTLLKNPQKPARYALPKNNRIKFMGQCSPVRRTVSQWSAPCNPAHVNLHAIYTHARVVRVSLADCCALGGKGTRGLKTPGYSKTVLRTENAAAAPQPFRISAFAMAWATVNDRP